jgi:predicted ATPase/DNA-binding winged helix-turn-helix (wHTH) protein
VRRVSETSRQQFNTTGPWEIDFRRRELRSRGTPVPVGGRAFEIVETLVRAAGELVTKDEIMRRVWPGAIVEENTLQVHISAIRKALGPDRAMLKTASGRGYRLLGRWTVRENADSPDVPTSSFGIPGPPRSTNLPQVTSNLIGRTTAVRELRELLSAYRIVTLTGPGGIGKTVLALKVSRCLVPRFADGIWLVELASLFDPNLVASAVATALGVKLGGGPITADSVARAIAGRQLLLILDNCEHVIDAATALAETVVSLCSEVSVLATSREVLRTAGECVYRVPPLEVPLRNLEAAEDAIGHSAVHLFVVRIQALLRSDFLPRREELATACAVCRHLDGIPLAIEFAAARAATLGLSEVAARLDDRFKLLISGRRTALPRHQTLRATLDWSYNLLGEFEQSLLRHVAVFPAGFTLEAAAAVIGDKASDVVDELSSLVSKSFLMPDGSATAGRWRLLETIRVYALEKLRDAGDLEHARRRHAEFFRQLIAVSANGPSPRSLIENMALFGRELDNVRAALDWAFAPNGDAGTGAILTAAYAPVWLNMALLFECRERTEQAIDRLTPDTDVDARVRMQLHLEHGVAVVFTMGSLKTATAVLRVAHEIAVSLNDANAEMRAHWALWVLNGMSSDFSAVRSAAEQFSLLAHRTSDPTAILFADRLVGVALQREGRYPEAQRCFERVLDRYVPPKNLGYTIWANFDPRVFARTFLARSLWLQGLVEQATAQALTAIEDARAAGNAISYCESLYFAACPIALMTGDYSAARQALTELINVSTANNSPLYRMWARGLEATLLIKGGEFASGLTILRAVLDTIAETGWTINHPELLGLAAEGLAGMGRRAEALATVDQALARAKANGGPEFVAELFRLKGEFFLQGTDEQADAAAEACFVESLTVAEEQSALFWQLRTAMSLARLKERLGREDDARQGLALVYGRFTEGFATADLLAAKRMLDSLSSRPV